MTSTWLQSWLQDQPSKGGQQQQRWAPGGPGSPSAHPIGGAASIAAAAGAFTEAVEDVEVTFRPSSVLAAALATPVHSWFANPLAFGADNDSGGGGGSPTRVVRSGEGVTAAAWGEGAEEGGAALRQHDSPGRWAQLGSVPLTGASTSRHSGGGPPAGASAAPGWQSGGDPQGEQADWVTDRGSPPAGSPGSGRAQPSQQYQHRQMPPAPVSSGVLVTEPQQWRWVPQGQDLPEAGRPSGVSGPDPHSVQSSYPSILPAAGRQHQDPYTMREQRQQQQYKGSTITTQAGNIGSGRTTTITGGDMTVTFNAPSPSPTPGAGLHSGPNDQQLLWALERRLEGRVEELGLKVEGAEAGLQGAR